MKILFSILILFLSTSVFSKNPFLPDCKMLGDTIISFTHCNYVIEDEDATYEGEANDGFMTGIASITFNNGDSFRGTLFDGTYAGYGKFEFVNGDILIGDVFENFKEGITVTNIFKGVTKLSVPKTDQGIMLVNDSLIYVGGLKNGNYHGEGLVYSLRDTEKLLKGQFLMGKWEGTTLISNYSKDIEKCEFDETGKIINEFCFLAEYYDDIELVGVYEFDELKLGFQRFLSEETEGLELGYFKNDVLHGYGYSSIDLTNTKFHFGNFVEGSANGYGILVRPDFYHYGEFKNDNRDGFGYYETDEQKVMGIYREGEGNGYFEFEHNDGVFSSYQVKNGKRDGLGYIIDGDEYYLGEIKNSKLNGFGTYYNGQNYTGGFYKDNELIEELEFCKKLFGDYYYNPKAAGCSGRDNSVTFREFIVETNGGLGDRWLEEYYKKERIKFD